jgi:hypothetical protein
MRFSHQRCGEPLPAKYQCLWQPIPVAGTDPIGSWRFPAHARIIGDAVRYEFSFQFNALFVSSWFQFRTGENPVDGRLGFLVETDFQFGSGAFNLVVPGLRWLEPLLNNYLAQVTFEWAAFQSEGAHFLYTGHFDLVPAPEWWEVELLP